MIRALFLAALSVVPAAVRAETSCLPPLAPADGPGQSVQLGARTATIHGHRLALDGTPDADDRAVIGVIASVNDAASDTLEAVDGYLRDFATRGVELVIVAGDSGESQKDIEAVLRRVAASGLPVLAFPGNVEPRDAFVAAAAAVHKDVPALIDGMVVRRIDWDDVTILTLPGHADPKYIRAGAKGCHYLPADVKALAALAKDAKAPVLLAAHTPPRGKGAAAVDWHYDGEHTGDPELAKLITSAAIPFGIFPNIKEAGGSASSDVDGEKPVAAAEKSATLYLNPGAANTLPWTLNDGSTANGMAAVLEIQGGKASYEVISAAAGAKLPAPTLRAPPPPPVK
jgi:hypothetical protein